MKWRLEIDPRNPYASRLSVDGQVVPGLVNVTHGIETRGAMVYDKGEVTPHMTEMPVSVLRLEMVMPDLEVEYKELGDPGPARLFKLPEIS